MPHIGTVNNINQGVTIVFINIAHKQSNINWSNLWLVAAIFCKRAQLINTI